jgi:hypothetical protein
MKWTEENYDKNRESHDKEPAADTERASGPQSNLVQATQQTHVIRLYQRLCEGGGRGGVGILMDPNLSNSYKPNSPSNPNNRSKSA